MCQGWSWNRVFARLERLDLCSLRRDSSNPCWDMSTRFSFQHEFWQVVGGVLGLWPRMSVSLHFTAGPRQRVGSGGWAGVPNEATGKKTSEARAEAFSWMKPAPWREVGVSQRACRDKGVATSSCSLPFLGLVQGRGPLRGSPSCLADSPTVIGLVSY